MNATPHPFARLAAGDTDCVIAVVAYLRSAGRPISLPGLCNAVWLEGLTGAGYEGSAAVALLDEAEPVAHGYPEDRLPLGPQAAVPIGAIVKLQIGSNWWPAEVVWKEGAHPRLEEGWVPRWLAGADALPSDGSTPDKDWEPSTPDRVIRERLVLDFDCYADSAPTPQQLLRLRLRGNRADRFGHLVVDAQYSREEDELDDVAFWAAWSGSRRAGALAECGLPAGPDGLMAAATNLADALDASPEVRQFGSSFLHAEVQAEAAAADDSEGGRLHRVVRGLAKVPGGDRVAWSAMSCRLTSELDEDVLVGTGWPEAVVTTSLLALDLLAEEAPDGDWHGTHLRLDDTWQGGGLWRAELLDGVAPVAAEPAVALGLGWIEHTGGSPTHVEDFEGNATDDGLGQDDWIVAPDWFGDADDDGEWEITGSEATWLRHLTGADIDRDRLPTPRRISEFIRETLAMKQQENLVTNLQHAGLSQPVRHMGPIREDGHLTMVWPIGVQVGTSVRASWSLGATVIVAATELLPEPEAVAGIIHTHVFNHRVALAASGQVDAAARPVTIRQLVRAAVRRHGEVTDDGQRCLTILEAVRYCFGPNGEITPGYQLEVLRRAVTRAALALEAIGAGRLDGDLIVVAERTSAAGRAADEELLSRYLANVTRTHRQAVARHWVAPTIVNMSGRQRSKAKDQTWASVAGTDGLPVGDLDRHQTWRIGFVRGGALPRQVTRELDRTRAGLERLGADAAGLASFEAATADPYADGTDPFSTPDNPPTNAASDTDTTPQRRT